jgi:hypothetical protein
MDGMTDGKFIEKHKVFNIEIAHGCINPTANTNHIECRFKQGVATVYKYDDRDRVRTPGLVGEFGIAEGVINHRFMVDSIESVWPEIKRRALIGSQLSFL